MRTPRMNTSEMQASAVAQAESTLKIREIIEAPCTGRRGLGTSHFQQRRKAGTRDNVQEELRNKEEGRRAVELSSQGAWTKWGLAKRKVTWPDLWRQEPFRISFLPRSVCDTPNPSKLALVGHEGGPIAQALGKGHHGNWNRSVGKKKQRLTLTYLSV